MYMFLSFLFFSGAGHLIALINLTTGFAHPVINGPKGGGGVSEPQRTLLLLQKKYNEVLFFLENKSRFKRSHTLWETRLRLLRLFLLLARKCINRTPGFQHGNQPPPLNASRPLRYICTLERCTYTYRAKKTLNLTFDTERLSILRTWEAFWGRVGSVGKVAGFVPRVAAGLGV